MTPQMIMAAAFADELEKIAGLPRRLAPEASAEGYTSDARLTGSKGTRRTAEGRMLRHPDVVERLKQHHEGRWRAKQIAKARAEGTRVGAMRAANLQSMGKRLSPGRVVTRGLAALLFKK